MTQDDLVDAWLDVEHNLKWFFMKRLGDWELAKDLSQELFIRYWTHYREGRAFTTIKGWLFYVAKNMVIDEYRKKSRLNYSLDSIMEYDESENPRFNPVCNESESVERAIDKMDAVNILKKLLPALTADESTTIGLRFFKSMTGKEIGERLGIGPNAAHVRVTRAIRKMRGIYQKKYELR